jgi:RNase P subunit RPR2
VNHKSFRDTWDFLKASADVWITCRRCGHQQDMTGRAFAELFGFPVWLHTATKRLRCSQCRRRGAKVRPIPT